MFRRPRQRPASARGRRATGRAPARGDRGAATAELALGLPLLVAVTAGLVWMLAVGTAQVRVVDASREAARAVARGDDPGSASVLARRIAPDGADVAITTSGNQVIVTTTAQVTGPGGLLGGMPGVTVTSEAVALLESG